MARMHSRKKGKSGSKRPISDKPKLWVKSDPKEISLIIDKLHKSGKTPSQIGMILRDIHGIPNIKSFFNKKLTQNLAERKIKLEIPEDLMSLIKRELILLKHLETNKHDMPSTRGLHLIESKIKRLVKYYKREGILPAGWVYDKEKIKLLVS